MSEADSNGLRVLIVDDNAVNRMVLEHFVGTLGADWRSAEDGVQAVDVAAREPFDVILMDMQMPRMDGLAATREIRRQAVAAGRTPAPIIMVSANCERADVAASLAAGAHSFVPKPVSFEKLVAALAEAFEPDPGAATTHAA
jgi:CheY-like chemotaxis protein